MCDMEIKVVIGKNAKPYVEVTAKLDYSLSADDAAELLRQEWDKKMIPLQAGLDAADAERWNLGEELRQRVMSAFIKEWA